MNDGSAGSSNGFDFGFMILLFFGMLMLSATAPTALAEERVLGSLDVLLATPLSTGSILGAKWWGMYRRVLVLAIVPVYGSLFLAATTLDSPSWAWLLRVPKPVVPLNAWDRLLVAVFCPADFLASGAMIVSWGLLLATWVPRLGRAVALSVIVFFLLGIGWPFLIELLFSPMFATQSVNWYDRNRALQDSLISFSPMVGPMGAIKELQQVEFHGRGPIWLGICTVILIKSAIASFLLWLGIKTFDRCFNRMPETGAIAPLRESAVRKDLVPSAAS
jgi:hypothetical protein